MTSKTGPAFSGIQIHLILGRKFFHSVADVTQSQVLVFVVAVRKLLSSLGRQVRNHPGCGVPHNTAHRTVDSRL